MKRESLEVGTSIITENPLGDMGGTNTPRLAKEAETNTVNAVTKDSLLHWVLWCKRLGWQGEGGGGNKP